MSKPITYTTESEDLCADITYRFSDGVEVYTTMFDGPTHLYMDHVTGESKLISHDELSLLKSNALHTTHNIHSFNEDGSGVFETYVINDTIPPRFEETDVQHQPVR